MNSIIYDLIKTVFSQNAYLTAFLKNKIKKLLISLDKWNGYML